MAPVNLDDELRRAVAARTHLLDDRQGVFAARVVRCQHRHVRETRGDRAHHGPLLPIPIAPAAEDEDHLAGVGFYLGPSRTEDLGQSNRCVGVVDDDFHTDRVRHDLEAPGGSNRIRQPRRDRRCGHAKDPRGRGRTKGVTHVDLTAGTQTNRLTFEAKVALFEADAELLSLAEREAFRWDASALEQTPSERVVLVDHSLQSVLGR